MHTAFNFDFLARPWDAAALRESIDATLAAHAPVGAPAPGCCPTTTSPGRSPATAARTPRSRSSPSGFGTPTDLALGRAPGPRRRLLVAALPGSLYIYQGDELGLAEVEDLPVELIQDPMHFRSGGVDPGRDGCRVPLPWSGDEPPFGFSPAGATAEPGCRSPPAGRALTVEAQARRPGLDAEPLPRGARGCAATEPGPRATGRSRWLPRRRRTCSRSAAATGFVCDREPRRDAGRRCPPARRVLLVERAARRTARLPGDATAWLRVPDRARSRPGRPGGQR